MPQVAEDAGVQIIAVNVAYTAEGITTKDVTEAVISQMGGGAPAPQTVPQQ